MSEREHVHDVVIVGGGISGTALAYVLSLFTKAPGRLLDILLLEKYSEVAEVNSNPMNNAQTSHEGDTETNYPLVKALRVKLAAVMLRNYLRSKNDKTLFRKTLRMVIGTNEVEVAKLKSRFREISPHYPNLQFIDDRDELTKKEPSMMRGRDPNKPFCALVSTEGFAVNYKRAAEHFLEDAGRHNPTLETLFSVEVTGIRRQEDGIYTVSTSKGTFHARVIVFTAGAYSLQFAHKMGYGKNLGILSVAGSFYSSGNFLHNKVYRMQVEGRPFAEVHGDPDILNRLDTRFGPTTKPLPLMERHRYGTFFDYIKQPVVSLKGFWILLKILHRNKLFGYVFKNMLFDLPVVGKALFLLEAREIVPTLKYSDLELRKGAGGVRPQIVNLETGELEMGDKTLVGRDVISGFQDRLIFNTTPSPGASVCLANGKRDAEIIASLLGEGYTFNKEAFEKEFERE